MPSTRWLTEKGTELFEGALLTHELFNLAQMLQGENCPGNVKELHSHIAEKGLGPSILWVVFGVLRLWLLAVTMAWQS